MLKYVLQKREKLQLRKKGKNLKNFRKFGKKNSVSHETSYELSFKNGDNFCDKLKLFRKTMYKS